MAEYDDMYYVNDTDDKRNGSNNSIVIPNRVGSTLLAKQKSGSMIDFLKFAGGRNYNIARAFGLKKPQALKAATYMSIQQALESQYGRSNAARNKNNRSGMMSNNGTIYYTTPDLNDIALFKSFRNNPNWENALSAPTMKDYFYRLQNRSNGNHPYEGTMSDKQYYNKAAGLKTFIKMANDYFNSSVTDSWSMNSTRRDLEDIPFLA